MRLSGFAGELQNYFESQPMADEGLAIGGVLGVLQFMCPYHRVTVRADARCEGDIPIRPWGSVLLCGEHDHVTVEAGNRLGNMLFGKAIWTNADPNNFGCLTLFKDRFGCHWSFGSRLAVPESRIFSALDEHTAPSVSILRHLERIRRERNPVDLTIDPTAREFFITRMADLRREYAELVRTNPAPAYYDLFADVVANWMSIAALLASDDTVLQLDVLLTAWLIFAKHGRCLNLLVAGPVAGGEPPGDGGDDGPH
jgi:hypothetical protein